MAALVLFSIPTLTCVVRAEDQSATPRRYADESRTLIVSRTQVKYGLERNYLGKWIDRPLFQDSSLREDHEGATPFSSFQRMVQAAESYGLDGLAFFPETSGRMCVFDYIQRTPGAAFGVLPEFLPSQNFEAKVAVLEAAKKNPRVARIGHRILITGYLTDSLDLKDSAAMLAAFRERFGDAFIFLPDISRPAGRGWYEWSRRVSGGQPLSEAETEAIREYLRSYLEVFDGLHFAGCATLKSQRRFDADFYRDVLIPVFRSVLDEPKHRGKYLGLSACIGHENCTRIGYGLSSDGTKTLRRSLEAALSAKPDVIVIPEWDEQNENTSLRPTVFNSFSTQRIIRHYTDQNRRRPLSSQVGDDHSTPNLIVSHRKLLTLGEALEIELLHVPDAQATPPYSVTFWLEDLDGRRAIDPRTVSFKGVALEDHTLRVPTEQLARRQVLLPVLQVEHKGNHSTFREGLHYIHLRATWNWDYKWVKTPLRDLCAPREASFELDREDSADGSRLTISGRIDCDEDIASVEVLEDDGVVYSVSPNGDSLRERVDVIPLLVEIRSYRQKNMRGTLNVRLARPIWPNDQPDLMNDGLTTDHSLKFDELVGWSPRKILFGIRSADADSAVVEIDSELVQFKAAVKSLLETEIQSRTYEDGLTVTLSRLNKQHDMPPHLNRRRARFSASVKPDISTSVFHLRVVTKSGKVYRSRPVVADERGDSELVELPVYSDSLGTDVAVKVASHRIPDIRYELVDDRGAVLFTPAGRTFWGHLGGYTDAVTHRGGADGLDGSPFVRRSNYPGNTKAFAPQWFTEDGSSGLRFDGRGTFIAFPQGTLPRRGCFTLSFEIKPTGDINKPQVLFAHHGSYIGSLTVQLTAGKLAGSFVVEQGKRFQFETDLRIQKDKWHRVRVSYNLRQIRFQLDDQQSEPFECRGPGLYDVPSVFGGMGGADGSGADGSAGANLGWFEGDLRALRVRHHVAGDSQYE